MSGFCNWHNPDGNGKYNYARFENPQENECIAMAFTGAQIVLKIEKQGAVKASMQFPINFCPVCGERVRLTTERCVRE